MVVALEIRRRIPPEIVAKLFAHRPHPRPAPGGDLADDLLGAGGQAADHDRPSGFDDAGLFRGDLFHRIAQHLAVVEADRGDRGHLGQHHVRRVEPAAQTNLDDADVAALPLELQKRHRGHELEETRMIVGVAPADFLGDGAQLPGKGDEFGLGQQRAVHLHALAQPHEMRRSIEAGAPAGRVQNGVEHGRGGAFAVGAREVDRGDRALRMTERLDEQAHPVDPEFDPADLETEKIILDRRVVRKPTVNLQLRTFNVHQACSFAGYVF